MATHTGETPRWSLPHRKSRTLVIALCVAAVVGVGGFTWAITSPLRSPSSAVSLLAARYFPEFPRTPLQFHDAHEYWRRDHLGAQAWDSLMPKGAGYIVVQRPEDFGLNETAPSRRVTGASAYQAAVVHQLHCLASIRDTLVRMERGEQGFLEDSDHPFHCLDYLRQSIQCAGDLALDAGVPVRLESGQISWSYTGMNALHSCRDWNVVKAFLADHGDSDFAGSILDT